MANDKRTASQRIDDLERAVMSIFQVTNNMSRDNTLIKNALKLMDNKIGAIMKASVAGEPLTEEVISKYMKEQEVSELKDKVTNLITQGFLVAQDLIEDGTFIVGSEDEPDNADGTPGKVVHSRLQFTLQSLDPAIQEKLKGQKVGSTVVFKDDALVFKVREVYKVVNPTPAAPVAEAPVAEQSSTNAEATQAAPEAAPVAGN